MASGSLATQDEARQERRAAAQAGNLSRTARALGVERNTLKRKLAKLGLAGRG